MGILRWTSKSLSYFPPERKPVGKCLYSKVRVILIGQEKGRSDIGVSKNYDVHCRENWAVYFLYRTGVF